MQREHGYPNVLVLLGLFAKNRMYAKSPQKHRTHALFEHLLIGGIASTLLSVPALAGDQTVSATQIPVAPAKAAPRKFYPLGYAPRPGNDVAASSSEHFYPFGYTPARPQSEIAGAGQKAVALSLPKSPLTISPVPPVTSQTSCKPPVVIKVGLVLNTTQLNIVALDDLELQNNPAGVCLGILPASSVWKVICDGAQLRFEAVDLNLGVLPVDAQKDKATGLLIRRESFAVPVDAENSAANSQGYILTCRAPDGLIGLNGKAYRGALWLHTQAASTFAAINILSLEDYLLSVVPSEMPSSWPMEALKAQAIAARSYALANLGKHSLQGFDVRADTEDQMYTGVLAETVSGNQAVAQTAGIVIKNQGKIVPAFYHSTSGGLTETAPGKSYPFLQQVADYDDASPKFTWTKKVPLWQLEQVLQQKTQRYLVGQVQEVEVVCRSPSKIRIAGSLGAAELSGDQARAAFGLPSTNFNVMLTGDLCIFSGRGFGHRMGLSQWGAKALAEHGYNAAQILSYYYKDVSLDYP